MSRRTLSDRQWDRIKELIRGKQTDRGVTGRDNRLFVDVVLWIARTGAPWRNLPPELGHWNNTWRRFARWVRVGVWESFFKVLADDPDFEYVIVNPTIVRAHQRQQALQETLQTRQKRRLFASPRGVTGA